MKLPRTFLAASLLLAAPAFAQTTDSKEKEKTLPPPADARHQLTAGVVVKAEPVTKAGTPATDPAESPRFVRLTINTAGVWRDWVRDQTGREPKSPRAAAAAGEKSIATAGEPRSAETLTTIVVGPDTRIETRYRAATDEVSEGARSPEGAAKAEARSDPADTSARRVDRSAAKPVRYTADDLKPGLWVEVHYKDAKSREKATLVRVMRPVGAAQASAADEKPASSK
ncbi:MAG TPA: hypothetical protein VGH33_20080 [Isosphaeraceae bacterium]|jgi:hypothetical protein